MRDPGSFRDPSGFIFYENNKVFRVINNSYKTNFELFINSGLFGVLQKENKIINHTILSSKKKIFPNQYKILEIPKINAITYPYEWCFSQLKAAALLTLEIQKISLKYDMGLKDATPYNIQFIKNKPIFIDTLSFEVFKDNYVWKPYKQFCEMFLGPLCLMAYKDPRLNKLLIGSINGISMDLINKLLPLKSKLNPSVFFHLVLQNKISSSKSQSSSSRKISMNQHLSIITQLMSFIRGLSLNKYKTEWGEYYKETINEKKEYLIHKEKVIENWIKKINSKVIWDIGANDGVFSKLAAKNNNSIVYSLDVDWKCVENNFKSNIEEKNDNVYPLLIDLVNPSPSIGWLNKERKSIFERLESPDLIMSLALIHHIINLNISIYEFVNLLDKSKKYVILEYVPIDDPKCKEIFSSRGDDFKYISEKDLVKLLNSKFKIVNSITLNETKRKLFLIKKN